MKLLLIAVILLFPYKRLEDTFDIIYDQDADRFLVFRCKRYRCALLAYSRHEQIARTESLDTAKGVVLNERSKTAQD